MKHLKRFNEDIDKEDIDNIFIDFKDRYEIHDDVYINHFNIRGNEGFSINFIINSDILIRIERGFKYGFTYETRHKFADFMKKEIQSSDEFQEAMDRLEEIGYKFDKISLHFDSDNGYKSIAEVVILFDKVKNKKILENLSNESELYSELKSISFILEDEGCKVFIYHPHEVATGDFEHLKNILQIDITIADKKPQQNFSTWYMFGDDPNGNRAYDVLSNSEILEEYIDRVEEIASNHGYKIQKIRKNIGPFHIILNKK